MPDQAHSKVQDEITSILLALSEREQVLLSAIVRIERENLHINRPKLKSELLKKVKEVFK